jgi:predicted Zn finger-like uncharacterized protein
MLLICPKCATSYQVDTAAVGAAGRSVRCARCHTQWFAAPPAPPRPVAEPAIAGAPEADRTVAAFREALADDAAPSQPASDIETETPEPAPALQPELPDAEPPAAALPDPQGGPSLDDLVGAPLAPEDRPAPAQGEAQAPDGQALPMADAPPLAPGDIDQIGPSKPDADADKDIEAFARRRATRGARRRKSGASRWPVIVVLLGAVLAGLLIWRGKVVQHAPQMASLYAAIGLPVNLRGLTFSDVKTSHETHDGVPVLAVQGTIANASSAAIEVPRLRFAVQNVSGSEIYAWTAQPAQAVLAAGATLPFRSRLASPPPDSQSVVVRFFNRRDALAGTR